MKQDYWFKRRRYGWGFTPVTWQGFASTLIVIAIALSISIVPMYDEKVSPTKYLIIIFTVLFIDIVGFIILTLKKAPTPKWRWGKKSTDNPREDF